VWEVVSRDEGGSRRSQRGTEEEERRERDLRPCEDVSVCVRICGRTQTGRAINERDATRVMSFLLGPRSACIS
jgi:hypothetical protein